jgi:hypothetical protein
MNGKDNGLHLSDLEKEIDSAVDNLLVKKKERTNPVPPRQAQSPTHNIPPEEVDTAERPTSFSAVRSETQPQKAHPSFEITDTVDKPVSLEFFAQKTTSLPRELQVKLEEVEAQLLTLEWDLNAKNINSAITHLQDLRKYSFLGNELEKVIIMIQKVLYQLILDENKLTPAALKFLQKSWKAVKGMTDERFSLEIDKGTVVRELFAEFQKLRIDEKVTKEKTKEIEARRSFEERMEEGKSRGSEKPFADAQISIEEIGKFMSKLEALTQVVNEGHKKWESIHLEILSFKADLQNKLRSAAETSSKLPSEEHAELAEEPERFSHQPSNLESKQDLSGPIAVSLFRASGVVFGFPEKQIIRIFPIKKWVSDTFIERGKVKLKNREIPLFNIFQVFKLKTSTEDNPLVLLIKSREDHPAAVIIDQAISREEMEYQPIVGRPYILGQGISRRGKVWILDIEQISS